ncbi:MAG: hypothetical protein BWY06_01486 [Candidatus Latescibacteria bacterium ADurb.Bin168]|nr:MAG: hypothetical protein BWY06_01486 [Candidatus Latescibacteria bacterium ADurb.Bin168]
MAGGAVYVGLIGRQECLHRRQRNRLLRQGGSAETAVGPVARGLISLAYPPVVEWRPPGFRRTMYRDDRSVEATLKRPFASFSVTVGSSASGQC